MLDDEGYCMECGLYVGGGDCPDCDHDVEPEGYEQPPHWSETDDDDETDDEGVGHEPGDDYRTRREADDA